MRYKAFLLLFMTLGVFSCSRLYAAPSAQTATPAAAAAAAAAKKEPQAKDKQKKPDPKPASTRPAPPPSAIDHLKDHLKKSLDAAGIHNFNTTTYVLYDAGDNQSTDGSWNAYSDEPYAKIYTDFTLGTKLQFHSLIKLIPSPTPVVHAVDFTEAYFTTVGKTIQFRAGKRWLPFSDYPSLLFISPVTKIWGHINQYSISSIIHSEHTSTEIYLFKPYNKTQDGNALGYGLNFQYHINNNVMLGGSYISSIADSLKMRYNTITGGFLHQTMQHAVPAISLYTRLNIKSFYLYSAWITSTSAFDEKDFTFNKMGAHPSAASIEFGRQFKIKQFDSAIIFRTEWTNELLGIGLAKKIITLGFNLQLPNRWLLQLQVNHTDNYAASDQACEPSLNKCTNGTGDSGDAALIGITVQL